MQLSPATFNHLTPRDSVGLFFLSGCVALTALALWLSSHQSLLLWMMGQILLAFALTQWFVLLHECGHDVLFRRKWLNLFSGHLASFFCFIPFSCWKPVHRKHHKWTGWKDLDPTTALLIAENFGAKQKIIIHICWKFWIPLFSVTYRLQNFWNLRRLRRIFWRIDQRRTFCRNICLLAIIYGGFTYWIATGQLTRHIALGVLLSLILQDLFLLSQHTHMPLKLSYGKKVESYPTLQQAAFTRSLHFPFWFAHYFLLHFNAHELHHMYPFVPGYCLGQIPHGTENEIGWWRWIREAKRLPGEVFLLQNRQQSGVRI